MRERMVSVEQKTIPGYIRRLAKEYYVHHGEKCRVTDKIVAVRGKGTEFELECEAYVCKVTDSDGSVTWTVVTEYTDSSSHAYVSEYSANDCKDVVIDDFMDDGECDEVPYDEFEEMDTERGNWT